MPPLNVPWSRSSDKAIACKIANTVAVMAQLCASPRLIADESASFHDSFQRAGMLKCTPSVCLCSRIVLGLKLDVHTVRGVVTAGGHTPAIDKRSERLHCAIALKAVEVLLRQNMLLEWFLAAAKSSRQVSAASRPKATFFAQTFISNREAHRDSLGPSSR